MRLASPFRALNLFFLLLLGSSLACNTTNMRARDIPEWVCPTPTVNPACLVTPEGPGTVTPGAPTGTPYPYPDECFWPTPTPYVLHENFRLGRRVRIGGVMGIGMGIWVQMDNVEVSGPYPRQDTHRGQTADWWVAAWDVWVDNASLTNNYEFYPFSQLYVLAVRDAQGSVVYGAWPVSNEAHSAAGIGPLPLTEGDALLVPGEGTLVRVAAFIPQPSVASLGYILDPLDTANVTEMIERNSLGSNVGVWTNEHEHQCPYGDINPLFGQFAGYQGEYVPGYLLTGHPVSGFRITRGFGCSTDWTGIMGQGCPASAPWFHDGIDYAATGAYFDTLPVGGSVIFAGADDGPDCSWIAGSDPPHNGFGNFVKHTGIVEGHTVVIWGGHLAGFATATGAPTSPGQVLGAVGSTGCSTGPHVHFRVTVDGRLVNPLSLIPPGGGGS